MKGKKGMQAVILGVIALVISVILIVNVVFPTIHLNAANMSTWSDGEKAMWTIIGLVVVAGLIFLTGRIFGIFGSGGVGG